MTSKFNLGRYPIEETVRAALAPEIEIEIVEEVIQGNSYLREIIILNSSAYNEYELKRIEVKDVEGRIIKVYYCIKVKEGMILFPYIESESLANTILKALKP